MASGLRRVVFLWCAVGVVACEQAPMSSSEAPLNRSIARVQNCSAGSYETTASTCALKLPGGTPAPLDTLSESMGGSRYDGCVSGEGDPNNYCVAPAFGGGDCAVTAQCANVRDSNNREVGCDPSIHLCSVPGCGPGSYVSADSQCHDKLASAAAEPSDTESGSPADGCVSGSVDGGACTAPATGSGDCWSDLQCVDVATANASTMGCMANHHCGPTACLPGYYVTRDGTCSPKVSGTPAPLDTLAESIGGSRYEGCVSNQGDPNNYCVPPAFGAGDCATSAQCVYVLDGDGREVGCDPVNHGCSVGGCGAGSYVSADGECHDKVASGGTAPSDTQSGNAADGCVSGATQGASCAAPSTGSGDCWYASQCTDITTDNASTIGCMANHHCGPSPCAPGYYVTSSGTCKLKVAGNTPAPLDTLSESIGGPRSTACVSAQGDGNNYCVAPAFGAGECANDGQCAGVTSAGGAAVLCDTTSHCGLEACGVGLYFDGAACVACSVCGAGERIATACATRTDAVCELCAPGTFTATTSSTTCTMCPADTYAAAGASACTACAAGSHALPGSNACTECASGTIYNSGVCTTCAAGTFATDDATVCAPCALGTYSSAGAASCTACAPGSAAGATGASSCILCDAGTFAATAGARTCDLCAAGTIAPNAGASSCEPCVAGTIAPSAGASSCEACPLGQFVRDGACVACAICNPGERRIQACTSTADTVCEPCTEGTFADVASSEACTLCPANTFAAAGASSCIECAWGTHSGVGSSTCSRCDAGTAYASGACTSCTPGSAAADDSVSCLPCGTGTYAATAGATTCTACAPGSHAALYGSASCELCSAGTFAASAGETACAACPAGTISAAGATACNVCPEGMFAIAGSASCTACGSCDDGNACTVDTCDASRGCTHTKTCGAGDSGPQTISVTGTGCAALTGEPEIALFLLAFFVTRRRSQARGRPAL